MRALFVLIGALAIAFPAAAEEKPVQLKKAPGLDKVEGNCSGCHSLDYIVMSSPFPNAALVGRRGRQMIKAFGAPISETDAKVIADLSQAELRHVAPPRDFRRAAKKKGVPLNTRFLFLIRVVERCCPELPQPGPSRPKSPNPRANGTWIGGIAETPETVLRVRDPKLRSDFE
jgi:hypothetical protein